MTTKALERPALSGFVIGGQHLTLSADRICKVFDRNTGAELDQVFYVNCDTGEYGFYAKGPDGSCPSLNEAGDECLREWVFGELILVFSEDQPPPLMRAMIIPVE